jgi:hypothetical protein
VPVEQGILLQRRHGLIALLVLAALALGYFGGRANAPSFDHGATSAQRESDEAISTKGKSGIAAMPAGKPAASRTHASAPLPAPGTPLKQTMAELKARADAGDAKAASRLYQDTQRCAGVREINAMTPKVTSYLLNQKTSEMSPETLKASEQALANFQKRLNFARDNAGLCADLSDDEINQLFPTALQAAQLGDNAAADCFVNGGATFGIPRGILDHPEWLLDYKQNALAIADTAITQGDWTMVSMLGDAYNNSYSPSMLGHLTGQDNVQAYRYLKLRLLGATSGGKGVDYLAQELVQIANEIPPDAKLAGDAWAQDAYQRYFAASPVNPSVNSYRPCNSDGF